MPIDYNINATYDGVTFKQEKGIKLFGTYFFMDNTIVTHEYTAYNALDILSAMGGLFGVICSFFGVAATWINEKTIMAKYIRSLYFINKSEKVKKQLGKQDQGKGGYSGLNDIMVIRSRFYNALWKKANKEQSEEINQKDLFEKGEEKVEAELCIFNILSTLQKLRASVSILVDR